MVFERESDHSTLRLLKRAVYLADNEERLQQAISLTYTCTKF